MKNIFLIIASICCSLMTLAQIETDTIKVVNPPVPPPPPPQQIDDAPWMLDSTFAGFDFSDVKKPPKNFEKFCVGTSTLLNSSGLPMAASTTFAPDMARSWNVNIDVAEKIHFAKDSKDFGWGYAISYGYQQIGLANNLRLHTLGEKTTVWQDSASSVTNNFRSFKLYVPLFIEYNYFLPKNKVFHVNLGTNLGVRTLRYCIKEKANDNSQLRILDKTNMNYNYFIADVFLRVGIDNFSIFLNRSVLPIFNENAGVSAVYPLLIGIAFGDLD